MLPAYFIVAVVSAQLSGIWWFILLIVGLRIVGQIYIYVIIKKKGAFEQFSNRGACMFLITTQTFVLFLIISFIMLSDTHAIKTNLL